MYERKSRGLEVKTRRMNKGSKEREGERQKGRESREGTEFIASQPGNTQSQTPKH